MKQYGYFAALIVVGVHLMLTVPSSAQTPDVRLVGGTKASEGRLEMRLPSGQWAAVCGVNFNLAAASVACRSLNFSYANWTAIGLSTYGVSTATIWVQGIDCFGTEFSLTQCARSPINTTTCSHDQDVSISCVLLTSSAVTSVAVSATTLSATTTTATTTASQALASVPSGVVTIVPAVSNCVPSPDLMLRDGSNAAMGRVHVRLNGVWGTVCSVRGWDTAEATVVCRQLCYNTTYARAVLSSSSSVVANSSVPIVMDSVSCRGNETKVTDCAYSPYNSTSNCSHRSDAMVSCVDYILGPPSAPVAEVSCSSVGAEVTFNTLADPALSIGDVTLQRYVALCSPSTTVTATSLKLTFGYSGCMSSNASNSSHIIYSATILYNQRGVSSSSIITRSTQYQIPVKCLLARDSPVSGGLNPLVQTAPPVMNIGTYVVSMLLFKDRALQVPIMSYPVNITLGDYLTVGVNLAADASSFRLVLPYCYATSAQNSGSTYVLLNQKCSRDPTLEIFSVNETMVGFTFQVFSFTTSASVYIHCDARVCAGQEVTSDCDRTCYSRRRRQVEPYSTYSLSRGPLIIQGASPGKKILPNTSSATAVTGAHAGVWSLVILVVLLL